MTAALNIILDFFFFFFSLFFLVKGTEILTNGLEKMSRSNNGTLFALTSFFAAIATSLPELLISISSALDGKPRLAMGLLMGSNIADITIVIGVACILGGSLSVVGDFVDKDIFRTLLMIISPLILALDGKLSRFDGIVLLIMFILYYVFLFNDKNKYKLDMKTKPFGKIGKWLHQVMGRYDRGQVGWLVIGVIMLLYSADIVVQSASTLALDLKLPLIFVGMFFAAFGSTLPEMVFSIGAIRKKKAGMVLGNLLGSLVANSTLILGLTIIISPISFEKSYKNSLVAIVVCIVSFLLLWLFVRTKYKLQRWEGVILALIYILFVIGEISILI